MKKLIAVALFIVCGLFVLSACSKKSNDPSSPLGGANLSGKSFTTIADSAVYYKSDSLFMITLVSDNSEILLATHAYPNIVGTYLLSSGFVKDATGTYGYSSGTLIVSSFNSDIIQGTFEFTTTNGIVAKNGTFKTSLKIYPGSSHSNNHYSALSAKVNGMLFTATISGAIKTDADNSLLISGLRNLGESDVNGIGLNLINFNGVGTYPIDSITVSASYASSRDSSYYSHTGQLVISYASADSIAGTFNFVTENNITISDGTFSMPLDHQ